MCFRQLGQALANTLTAAWGPGYRRSLATSQLGRAADIALRCGICILSISDFSTKPSCVCFNRRGEFHLLSVTLSLCRNWSGSLLLQHHLAKEMSHVVAPAAAATALPRHRAAKHGILSMSPRGASERCYFTGGMSGTRWHSAGTRLALTLGPAHVHSHSRRSVALAAAGSRRERRSQVKVIGTSAALDCLLLGFVLRWPPAAHLVLRAASRREGTQARRCSS